MIDFYMALLGFLFDGASSLDSVAEHDSISSGKVLLNRFQPWTRPLRILLNHTLHLYRRLPAWNCHVA